MTELRAIQERVSARLLETPLVFGIMNGKFRRSQYRVYLQDVYCYAKHSSVVIALAAARLVHTHPPLAAYLFRHAEEELGHDLWVASDLRDLGMLDSEIATIQPSSDCARMIGLEYYYAAHANPIGLVGWMFVLESLGGKVGGTVASAINDVLRLDGRALYFLRGHAEADAHHSEDLYRVVSENVVSQEDRRDFDFMVRESESLYCGLLRNAELA